MKVSRAEAEAAGHVKTPLLKIIRATCIDCSGGSEVEVRKCPIRACPLWPYRMGNNPFSGRKGNAAALRVSCG